MKEGKTKDMLYSDRWSPVIIFILRIIVGGVFVFSGFVKAIDPWGSLYKYEEYVAALGFTWIEPFVLFGAFAVAAIEFVFGVFMLLGAYRRGSTIVLLAMLAVMTPLTLWLAVTDAVPDCGCFGDALVISNWATFVKNLLLLIGMVYLLMYNKRAKNIYGVNFQWIVALMTFGYIMWIASLGYFYQPLLDFRPFKIGTRIEGKASGESVDDKDYVFVYEKDGEREEFAIDSLPDDSWTFVERIHIEKEKSAKSSETAEKNVISLRNEDGTEAAGDVIKSEGEQLLLIFSDMKDIDVSYSYLMNELYDFAQAHGVDMIGLASGTAEEIAEWYDLSMASYKMYDADDSELKMIARGNPSLVYIKDGEIGWKCTLKSVSADSLNDDRGDFEIITDNLNREGYLSMITTIYLLSMLILLILHRSHRVFKFSRNIFKKNQNKEVPLQDEKKE